MKRRAPVLDRDALTAEIAALANASIKALSCALGVGQRTRWRAYTLGGSTPSASLLNESVAKRRQA
jgi:hypothetical protein